MRTFILYISIQLYHFFFKAAVFQYVRAGK